MTDHEANLIAKFLAGEASSSELQELNRALANDPQTADALMSEAYLDVHLRETMGGSELGTAVREENCMSKTVPVRFATRWLVAASLFVAISGWTATAFVTRKLDQARTNIDTLHRRVEELERPVANAVAMESDETAPEIHRMRGLLMTSPTEDHSGVETELLKVGTTAPLNQRLWTCPWGATEFRYDSGVSIAVERNTMFELDESKANRQFVLKRGIVHVTHLSKKDKRPTEIQCPSATVQLKVGQVAVQVDEQQTSIEAALHLVKVRVDGVRRPFTVRRGQYLIVKPGETPKVMQGMLHLGLKPPNR